jgi:pimeloyl-ACP methyl ester carboxylesterase
MAYPIYVLHGWTNDLAKWSTVEKSLNKAGFKLKVLKIPGLTTDLNKVWNLDDYVAWFKRQVDSQAPIYVIAHSFGGRIALRFDVKNPNVIKKLILIDSAGIRDRSMPTLLKRFSFRLLAKMGRRLTKNPKAREILYKLARERDYYQAKSPLAETMAKIIEEDQSKELPFVKAHTLLIWGSQDKITPLDDGRQMNKSITGSALHIVNGAGHSPHYTHTSEVVTEIGKFLNPKKN